MAAIGAYERLVRDAGSTFFDREWLPPEEECAELAQLRIEHLRLLDGYEAARKELAEVGNIAGFIAAFESGRQGGELAYSVCVPDLWDSNTALFCHRIRRFTRKQTPEGFAVSTGGQYGEHIHQRASEMSGNGPDSNANL